MLHRQLELLAELAHRSFLDNDIGVTGFVRAKLDSMVTLEPILSSLQYTATIRAASEQLEGVSLRNLGARLPSTAVSSPLIV